MKINLTLNPKNKEIIAFLRILFDFNLKITLFFYTKRRVSYSFSKSYIYKQLVNFSTITS